jgi:FkbM family methyltransferase
MARTFNLVAVEQKHVPAPIVRPDLPALDSEERMLEVMARLPILRAPRAEFDPKRTAVVCHAAELAQAVAWYAERYSPMPALYVEGDVPGEADDEMLRGYAHLNLLPFAALRPGMDVQLFFPQAKAPRLTSFPRMAQKLHEKGFAAYGIEEYSLSALWGRGRKVAWSPEDLRGIRENFNALADPFSRYVYLAACKARLDGDPGCIPLAGYPQYFHPLASVQPGDVLCEGGIDDGKTTQKFYEAMQGRGQIFAFEPVAQNFERSLELLRPYAPAVQMVRKALWSETGSIYVASHYVSIAESAGSTPCECVSIDDFFADQGPVDCIKLDVEGAELPVLRGAAATLRRYRPRLMISIYHTRNGNDYINIPRWIRELDLGYRFYVGHHRPWWNETILYGTPG